MPENLIARVTININAPISKVWEALITPTLIKQYLFGTEVTADWRIGGAITYKGTWQGTVYEDKGEILKFVPEKMLKSTYWSSMAGLADDPENYKRITYELFPVNDGTQVVLMQDSNATHAERLESQSNWKTVLGALKKLLEKKA